MNLAVNESGKPLSESSKLFTLSNLEAEHIKKSESLQESRSYEPDEFIIQSPSMRRGFTYDSEKARNFDQSNVNKAKLGVKELLKDVLDKAKRQAMEIKSHAQKEGHDAGYTEGFKKGEDEAREEFKPFLHEVS